MTVVQHASQAKLHSVEPGQPAPLPASSGGHLGMPSAPGRTLASSRDRPPKSARLPPPIRTAWEAEINGQGELSGPGGRQVRAAARCRVPRLTHSPGTWHGRRRPACRMQPEHQGLRLQATIACQFHGCANGKRTAVGTSARTLPRAVTETQTEPGHVASLLSSFRPLTSAPR
jgi:hypothetical protein